MIMYEKVKNTDYISPALEYLASLDTEFLNSSEMAKWMWSKTYTRSYFRCNFHVEKQIISAELEFQSDSKINIYLNGNEIEVKKNNSRYIAAYVDVSSYIVSGVNRIGIRQFCSDNPQKFHVAIRGRIHITYSDGTIQDIKTGENWTAHRLTGFWQGTENNGWYMQDAPGTEVSIEASDIHPIHKKRACLFRKSFELKGDIKKASLYSGAMGLYVPYLNGIRATEDRFIPGSMDKAAEYQVYDVTNYIKQGKNIIAAETGNGWYNCCSWGTFQSNIPALMMHLEIELADGSVQTIKTDTSWKVQASPRIENDIQYGERYDARLEIENWNCSDETEGFENFAVNAKIEQEKPFIRQEYPAVRIQKEYMAVEMGQFPDGSVFYRFENNSTGRARIRLRNTKCGEMILIRYCEILCDGKPFVDTYGDVFYRQDTQPDGKAPYGTRNMDVYICKGAEEEIYMPEFSFTGFRYIYLSGYSGAYTLDMATKVEMNTNLEIIGDFSCSAQDLNQIWDAVKRSYRSNAFTGPLDCPTREKNFWNGDIQCFASTANWYTDNNQFLSAWTKYGRKIEYGVYGWEDEEYILPLILYRYYGNQKVLEDKYPVLQSLIERRKSDLYEGELLPINHAPYGDHQAVINVPGDFFAAAYYCLMYKDAAEIAEILEKETEALYYCAEFGRLRKEFNRKYFLSSENDYSPRCQSGIVLPMAFGLAPQEALCGLAERLHLYVVKDEYHLTTGFMSSEHILGILCEYGYDDDAWKIMTNQEYPSLINMLKTSGCKTTTETWKGYDLGEGFSMNHYAIGGTARYFFEELCGVKITEPGFLAVRLKPYFRKELESCSMKYRTVYGELESSWKYDKDKEYFLWTVHVPEKIKTSIEVPVGMTVERLNETKYIVKR